MPPLDLSLYRQDEGGRRSESNSPCPIPAPEPALGSHPCGALSSAQVALVYVKKSNPAKPKSVNHVSGTKCKPCAGLDPSPSGLNTAAGGSRTAMFQVAQRAMRFFHAHRLPLHNRRDISRQRLAASLPVAFHRRVFTRFALID
jgi:hypothetical protein